MHELGFRTFRYIILIKLSFLAWYLTLRVGIPWISSVFVHNTWGYRNLGTFPIFSTLDKYYLAKSNSGVQSSRIMYKIPLYVLNCPKLQTFSHFQFRVQCQYPHILKHMISHNSISLKLWSANISCLKNC